MWEDRRLRDLTEDDVRRLISAGQQEHFQLEYKGELYGNSDHDTREYLRDICMFANSGGGIVLIGVPERRDEEKKPTGFPDPEAQLGIEISNPEQVLQSLDAKVIACIDERLPVEFFAVPVRTGLYVLAIRVPNSLAKPHRVYHQGRVNFPARRERHRYEMDVREIKELVMKTASRIEQAEGQLNTSMLEIPRKNDLSYLLIGCIPIFSRDFSVDIKDSSVTHVTGRFLGQGNFVQPIYTFNGLELPINNKGSRVQIRRNGLILAVLVLSTRSDDGHEVLFDNTIDQILRRFVIQAAELYKSAALAGPYLVGMMLRPVPNLVPGFPLVGMGSAYTKGPLIGGRDYLFPTMQADNLTDIDKVIRPLCDQIHQTFGHDASPNFDAKGVWTGPLTSD